MRFLPPQRLMPDYWLEVKEDISDFFESVIFEPVFKILMKHNLDVSMLHNALSPSGRVALDKAIWEGRIHYSQGKFFGNFDDKTSAALKELGAQMDLRTGIFFLPELEVPNWIKALAERVFVRGKAANAEIEAKLDDLKNRLAAGQLDIPIFPESAIDHIEEGFRPAAEALGIPFKIPKRMRDAMEKNYAEDVRPYVVKATAEFIDDLHKDVTKNAAQGFRYDHLVEDIQAKYLQTERKARFLARQETALFMAHYREERFKSAGVRRYKWSNSHDSRVRPAAGLSKEEKEHAGNHRIIDGKIFYYETKAPAQYMSRHAPSNPGEDYNCRCVDIAIIE